MYYITLIIAKTKEITSSFGASGYPELVQSFKYYEAPFMSLWFTFDQGSYNPTSGKCFISLNQKKIKSKDVSDVP